MREQLRGFAQGVKYLAALDGVVNLASEIEAISAMVDQHESLRDILTDPSIANSLKAQILGDIFSKSVSSFALQICAEAIELEDPARVIDALALLPGVVSADLDEATGALTTTSRVRAFSRALFSSLRDLERLSEIEASLFQLRDVVASNPNLRRALSGIGTVSGQRIGIISDLLGDSGDPIFRESIRFAASTGRIRDFVEVLELMAGIAAALRNTRIAEVHVAKPLSSAEAERVGAAISGAYGSRVEVREIVDKEIIGGVMAIVGDTIFDGSVRHRLEQLKGRLGLATTAR